MIITRWDEPTTVWFRPAKYIVCAYTVEGYIDSVTIVTKC